MNAREKFLELKKAWVNAKGNPALRAEIDNETDAFFDSLTDEQKKEVVQTTSDEFKRMHNEISDMNKTLNVRDALADVLPFISVSHLSKQYFGKSASWFYQRMNGNIVHGKPAKFLPEEVEKLNYAIKDISTKLGAVCISI
ncbi:MAG: DUF5053 domain-containing protein [Candidatus Azobacteroides sp.]|nr:DUF5053 domain-containing protein [Candidatus Azobacteroides sp.]